PRTRRPSRLPWANRAPNLQSLRRLPRNPQQSEFSRTRAGPAGLTGRCVRLAVEPRTGPPSALGWASERTVSQSNLAEPDGVLPAIVAAASLREGNPEERLSP